MIGKKGTRLIMVDGVTYRWKVTPDSGFLRFIATSAETNGTKLEVLVNSDIDQVWLEFPDAERLKEMNLRVITPKDAANMIKQAVHMGWDCTRSGGRFFYHMYDDNVLFDPFSKPAGNNT